MDSSSIAGTSAAVLAVAAMSLATLGRLQRRYAGFGWWVGAMWAAAAGALLTSVAPAQGPVAAMAAVLLAQWPLATLAGLRRFHARMDLPAGRNLDGAVAALCLVAAGAAPLARADSGVGPLLGSAALMLSHLYAASLLFGGAEGREDFALRLLALVMALVGLSPVLDAAPWPLPPGTPLHVAAIALGAMVMAFVALTLMHDRTERQLIDSRQRLRALANLDPLTDLPNRRHFEELVAALDPDESPACALLMFDIDHFKQINDHLGHAAGDRALRLVARSMSEHLRVQDTETRVPPITLSFGIVQMRRGERLGDALRRADVALYEAKRQGRSRAVAASGDEERPVFTDSQRLGLSSC